MIAMGERICATGILDSDTMVGTRDISTAPNASLAPAASPVNIMPALCASQGVAPTAAPSATPGRPPPGSGDGDERLVPERSANEPDSKHAGAGEANATVGALRTLRPRPLETSKGDVEESEDAPQSTDEHKELSNGNTISPADGKRGRPMGWKKSSGMGYGEYRRQRMGEEPPCPACLGRHRAHTCDRAQRNEASRERARAAASSRAMQVQMHAPSLGTSSTHHARGVKRQASGRPRGQDEDISAAVATIALARATASLRECQRRGISHPALEGLPSMAMADMANEGLALPEHLPAHLRAPAHLGDGIRWHPDPATIPSSVYAPAHPSSLPAVFVASTEAPALNVVPQRLPLGSQEGPHDPNASILLQPMLPERYCGAPPPRSGEI